MLILASACLGPLHPSLERSELVADPASRLRMPGAEELAHFAREREFTVEGPAFSFDRYLFGTMATTDEVVASYDRELRRLGWTPDRFAVVSGTTDLRVRGWCKPRMAFRVAEKDQDVAFNPSIYRGKTYTTFFDAGLLVHFHWRGKHVRRAAPGRVVARELDHALGRGEHRFLARLRSERRRDGRRLLAADAARRPCPPRASWQRALPRARRGDVRPVGRVAQFRGSPAPHRDVRQRSGRAPASVDRLPGRCDPLRRLGRPPRAGGQAKTNGLLRSSSSY